MSVSQQVIHSLSITKLKGISLLDEIRFDEKPLTAILGPNGCGKSTILHALACCYKPIATNNQTNWKFSDFFTPTTDATWAGSSIKMTHSYRNQATEHSRVETEYGKKADRWAPRYATRLERYVRFIGIKTCVPRIEEETYTSAIKYQTEEHADATLIKSKMGMVFNRDYTELNLHRAHGGRQYLGLALEGSRYSALAMGAGEQRVLEILSAVFNAPKNGLIIIDEIDLLLHTAALKKLIQILHGRANEKSLQIVFTTHREAILELIDIVSTKHIHTVKTELNQAKQFKTYCFSDTKPDALERLTGQQSKNLEVFVEDDLAYAIVENELNHLEMRRHVNIACYGAATNCFTLAAGLILSDKHSVDSQLFLLDGDLFVNEEDRRKRVNAVLSGNEIDASARREQCLFGIKKLCAQSDTPPAPEAQVHRMLCSLSGSEFANEIVRIAKEINVVEDSHSYIDDIIQKLNMKRPVGLANIISTAAKAPAWEAYVAELREWLKAKKPGLTEGTQPAA